MLKAPPIKLVTYYKLYKFKLPIICMAKIWLKMDLTNYFRILCFKLVRKAVIGKRVTIEKDIFITPFSHIRIGNESFIGRRGIIEIRENGAAALEIGESCWISHDCHIQANNDMKIGNKVLIGEFVSLRDTSHNYAVSSKPIKDQGDTYGKIVIEDGVWIGRGCLILGKPTVTIIGENSIIAANSTVISSIPPNTVWGGSPAKFIKDR